MKKVTICLMVFLLCLVMSSVDVYANFWDKSSEIILISSDKDIYEQGEKAEFEIKVKKKKQIIPVNAFDFEASFPDEATIVELTKISHRIMSYNPTLNAELAKQTLTVSIYHKGYRKIIQHLEREKEEILQQIEYLKNHPPKKKHQKQWHKQLLKLYRFMLQAVECKIHKFSKPIASGSKTISLNINTGEQDPPLINITGVTANTFYNADVTPQVTITDASAVTSTTELNGAAYISGTPITAEADYTLVVSAEDIYGNSSSQSISFHLDKTLPVIVIAGVDPDGIYNNSIIPEILVTDANLDTSSSLLNGVSYVSGTEISVEGNYSLEVTAIDKAGNQVQSMVIFSVDMTAPVVVITSPVNNFLTNQPQIIVEGTVDDPKAFVSVNGNNAQVTGNTFSLAIALAEEGNVLVATAIDQATNQGVSSSVLVTLDTNPPQNDSIEIVEGEYTNELTVNLNLSADGASEMMISSTADFTGALWEPYAVSKPFELSVGDGLKMIYVKYKDLAGNETIAISDSITLDQTKPVAVIVNPLDGFKTNNKTLIIEGTIDDETAKVTVNNQPAIINGNTFSLNLTLSEGENIFQAKAVDLAGNEGVSLPITVTLDQTAPIIEVVSPQDGSFTNQAIIILEGNIDDSEALVYLAGEPLSFSGNTFTAPLNLNEGNNQIELSAQDSVGNSSAIAINVGLDSIEPSLSIVAPSDGEVISINTPIFTVSFDDSFSGIDLASFNAQLGGVDISSKFQVTETGATYTVQPGEELANSEYPLTISIKDNAGNNVQGRILFKVATESVPPVQEQYSAYICGTVYHSRTMEPITFAEVRIKDGNEVVYTDSDGKFKYPINESRYYILEITKDGFTWAQRIANVKKLNQNFGVDIIYLTPMDTAITAITPEGGVAVDSTGKIEMTFPAGAVSETISASSVWFEHGQELPGALPETSHFTYAMELCPDGATFSEPVTIKFANTHGFVPGMEIPVGYYNRETSQWEHESMASVDPTGAWVVFQVTHFSSRDINCPIKSPNGKLNVDKVEDTNKEDNDFRCNSKKKKGNSLVDMARGRLYMEHSVPGMKNIYGNRNFNFIYNSYTANPVEILGFSAHLADDFITPVSSEFEIKLFGDTKGICFEGIQENSWYKYIYDCRDKNGVALSTGSYLYERAIFNGYPVNYATTYQFGGPAVEDTGILSPWPEYYSGIIEKEAKFVVNNNIHSSFGSGWGLEEIYKLENDLGATIFGSLIITRGDGSLKAYRSLIDGAKRVSISLEGEQANSTSAGSAINEDGRFIAFISSANNLVENDTNGRSDVFVYDSDSGEIKLVSLSSQGNQQIGGGTGSADNTLSISGDGRYVAFASHADNLVSGDTNNQWDVFVHDNVNGVTKRISVASDGTQAAYSSNYLDYPSEYPSISSDGRYVAFYSKAPNLVEGDTNNCEDVFVHDMISGETKRISVSSSGVQGDKRSRYPSISVDGRYVSFASEAITFVPDDTTISDIFVHDLQTGETKKVSLTESGVATNKASSYSSISGDGRYIAFDSVASNIVSGDTNANYGQGGSDIFVYDRIKEKMKRVSVSSSGAQGQLGRSSQFPSISIDGRYVSFSSDANNLVPNDTNNTADIFVYDTKEEITKRLSVSSEGLQASGYSSKPLLSNDGQYVTFVSNANNLVSGDTNSSGDVFMINTAFTTAGKPFVSPQGDTSTLIKNYDDTYTLSYKNGIKINFDIDGYEIARVDTNNNSTTYQWQDTNGDNKKELIKIIDPGSLEYDFTYDTNGKLLSLSDPAGRITYFDVDVNGNLVSIKNADNTQRDFVYNDNHLMTSKKTENQDVTDYIWDEFGFIRECLSPEREVVTVNEFGVVEQLSQREHHFYLSEMEAGCVNLLSPGVGSGLNNKAPNVTTAETVSSYRVSTDANVEKVMHNAYKSPSKEIDPLGRTIESEYDAENNLVKEILPNGAVISMTYDESCNMLTKTQEAISATTIFTYEETFNKIKTVTDALNHIYEMNYDGQGNLLSVKDPDNNSINLTYTTKGLLETRTDRLGNVTEFEYDTVGRVIQVIKPEVNGVKPVTTIAYNNYGYIQSITDAENKTTQYDYDVMGRLTKSIDPLLNETLFEYDNNGNMIKVIDSRGNITIYNYDAVDLLTKITYPDNSSQEYFYDERRQLTLKRNIGAGGSPVQEVKYIYNEAGELIKMIDPLGYETELNYNDLSLVASVTDAKLNTTLFNYDPLGRLLEEIDPLSNSIKYSYDKVGNLKTLEDQKTNLTSYIYDVLNRVQETTYPDSSKEIFDYDNESNLLTKTTRKGDIISHTYDPLQRLINKSYSGNSVDYTYNKISLLTSAVDTTGTYSFGYDANRRLLSETTSQGTISYEYDFVGNRTKTIYPDNSTINYNYNNMNQVSQITDWNLSNYIYAYDSLSRLQFFSYPNGIVTNYTFDESNQLTAINTKLGTIDINKHLYQYDKVGNRTSMESLRGVENYTYDAINQLTQVTYPNAENVQYAYDPAGNREILTKDGVIKSYASNNLNQYSDVDETTLNYDTNGNLTGNGTATYTYDALNRLIAVVTPEHTVSFTYDPFGRRISKTVDGVTENYVYSGSHVIMDTSNGSLKAKYLYGTGIDDILMQEQSSMQHYYHKDGLDSVTALTDGAAAVVERYTYDVFGQPTIWDKDFATERTESTEGNRYLFTGREYDSEVGLYYYRARHYDPVLGRFLQTDPLGYYDSANLYQYVENSPNNFVDPYGLMTGLSGLDLAGGEIFPPTGGSAESGGGIDISSGLDQAIAEHSHEIGQNTDEIAQSDMPPQTQAGNDGINKPVKKQKKCKKIESGGKPIAIPTYSPAKKKEKEKLKGGKIGQRDQGLRGFPKKFKHWLHRMIKGKGDPDFEPSDIKDYYKEWINLGKPEV